MDFTFDSWFAGVVVLPLLLVLLLPFCVLVVVVVLVEVFEEERVMREDVRDIRFEELLRLGVGEEEDSMAYSRNEDGSR